MARRASVTKPLSVIMAPTRSSRKVRAERFGTAWARRVSQAQKGVGIEVSMGRNRRTSNTLQLRAFTLKGQQATKNLAPEDLDKAAETLNSNLLEKITKFPDRPQASLLPEASGSRGVEGLWYACPGACPICLKAGPLSVNSEAMSAVDRRA